MERQTNREQVVATAAELFIRRGVANTSMDDVVRASGVAKSNIYYHFKSKEEILLAVLDHQIDQFEREILEPVVEHRSASVMDSLKLFVARLAAELAGRDCAGGCPFITLGTQTAGTNPAVKERIARFFTDQTAKLERMIAYAMLKGEVRKDLKPAEVAGLLMSTIEGSLFLAEVNHAPELLERRALLLLDLLRPNP